MKRWLILYIVVFIILMRIHPYVGIGYIALTYWLSKRYVRQLKGYFGEKKVQRQLKALREHRVYNDMYILKRDGQLTQVDHIVTSPFGVFVIETKNYAGWIFGVQDDMYWTQSFGKKKFSFYSPVRQNAAHVAALQDVIGHDVPVYSVVVFSDAATLNVTTDEQTVILQMKEVRNYLKSFQTRVLTKTQLAQLNQSLQAYVQRKGEKRHTKRAHIRQLHINEQQRKKRSTVTHTKQQVSSDVESSCPACGSPLVKRSGKHGTFYGCQSFPTCRFTKNIS